MESRKLEPNQTLAEPKEVQLLKVRDEISVLRKSQASTALMYPTPKVYSSIGDRSVMLAAFQVDKKLDSTNKSFTASILDDITRQFS